MARLLFVALFCFFSLVANADIIATKYFDIHHALTESDRLRFEKEIASKLDAYVDTWISMGIANPSSKTRIYIQPDESLTKMDAIQRLYGDNFLSDFAKLEAMENSAELIKGVKAFAISYPPMFRKALDRDLDAEKLRSYLKRFREGLTTAEPLSLYGEGACHISLKYYDAQATNAILLGKSTDVELEHPYFRLDTAFHEIGHEFFSPLFAGDRREPALEQIPGSLNEMFADVVAATYLNDPCRIKSRSGSCERDLSRHEMPLNQHLWQQGDPHTRNEPVAHLLWEVFKSTGFAKFAPQLTDAVRQALKRYPAQGSQYSRRQINRDIFLDEGLGYINDYTVLEYVAKTICGEFQESAPACQTLQENFLGDATDDMVVANNYIANAPTNIQENPRRIKFGEEEATIWFTNTAGGREGIVAHFASPSVSGSFSLDSSQRSGTDYWRMNFVSSEISKKLIWHYAGTVEIVPEHGS